MTSRFSTALLALVLIGLLGTMVFGLALSDPAFAQNNDTNCLGAMMHGMQCPGDRIDFALHHVQTLRALSEVPPSTSRSLFVSVLALFLGLFALFHFDQRLQRGVVVLSVRPAGDDLVGHRRRTLLRSLARFLRSPATY